MVFGESIQTVYSVKLLLCRAIDDSLQRTSNWGRLTLDKKTSFSDCNTANRPTVLKKVPTTPQAVLDMLDSLNKKDKVKRRANNFKAVIKQVNMEVKSKSRPTSAFAPSSTARGDILLSLEALRVD
jgi:hypothetical protein